MQKKLKKEVSVLKTQLKKMAPKGKNVKHKKGRGTSPDDRRRYLVMSDMVGDGWAGVRLCSRRPQR